MLEVCNLRAHRLQRVSPTLIFIYARALFGTRLFTSFMVRPCNILP